MFIEKNKLALVLVVSLLVFPACKNTSKEIAESTQVVAKVNDKEITTSFVERRINQLSPIVRKALATQKGQKDFIDSLVANQLIVQTAKDTGIEKTPEFITRVTDYKNDLLVQMYLQKEMLKQKIDVTEEEIKKFYDSSQGNFQAQPEVRISHIFLTSEVEAKDVLKQIHEGADFAKLAFEKSANKATAARGGDMGYLRKWQLPEIVADKIFSMQIGDVSDIVPSEFGHTILKVTDKRTGETVAMEAVSQAIKTKLYKDKQRESINNIVEELKKKAKITVNENILANLNLGGETTTKAPQKPETSGADINKSPE